LCGFLILLSVFFLISCGKETTTRPFDCLVTFHYNYGKMNVDCPDQYLGVKTGQVVAIMPGYSESFKEYEVPGYYLDGWYLPEVNAAGEPVVDKETGRVRLAERWDFATGTVTSDMTLYANLVEQPTLSFVDADTGAEVSSIRGNPGTQRQQPSQTLAPKKEGYTLFGYYQDPECTQPFAFPYTFTKENETAYVKFLAGNWLFVDDAAGFQKGVQNNLNLYLTADIDFAQYPWVTSDFNGTINGNGHKLTGITIDKVGSRNNLVNFGLFGRLGANTHIYDLEIADVSIRFTAQVQGTYQVAPLAQEMVSGARLERVTVSGSLTYDISVAPTTEVYPLVATGKVPDGAFTDCTFTITLTDAKAEPAPADD